MISTITMGASSFRRIVLSLRRMYCSNVNLLLMLFSPLFGLDLISLFLNGLGRTMMSGTGGKLKDATGGCTLSFGTVYGWGILLALAVYL